MTGSRQFRKYTRNTFKHTAFIVLLFLSFGFAVASRIAENKIVSVVVASDVKIAPPVTPTPTMQITITPTPSELETVISYITKKFEPEGKQVVLEAITCFYSESSLRPEAYNFNKNGTEDRGIAQINSIHGLTPEESHDISKNIDKAYQIYKSRGWDAWYGKGCD